MAIVKFNGGNPVVLCSDCRVIIRYIGRDEEVGVVSYSSAEYCKECN